MPALESHTGLLKQTIPYYNRRNFVDVSNTLRHYTAFPALQRNMKRAIDSKLTKFNFGLPNEVHSGGGTEFKWNVQVTSNNTGDNGLGSGAARAHPNVQSTLVLNYALFAGA